jgi:sugar-specific transcriptional regulator TrmB
LAAGRVTSVAAIANIRNRAIAVAVLLLVIFNSPISIIHISVYNPRCGQISIYGLFGRTPTDTSKNLSVNSLYNQEEGAKVLEEEITVLAHLGLTVTQAKVFMALVISNASGIKEISEVSKVHRTDIYRIIEDLEKEGLVEREIATPSKFRAIPIDECVEMLFQKRNREDREMRKKAAKLIRSHREKTGVRGAERDESRSWVVPTGRVIEKIGQAIDRVNESIDVVLPWNRFSSGFSTVFSDRIEKALSREVKLRFAVVIPGNGEYPVNQLDSKRNDAFCEIRFLKSSSYVVLGIYDQKEVSVAEFPDAKREKSHILWSTNKALVSMAKDYFEALWNKAAKELPESSQD